tara:strand:- start:1442 stop:1702 length:261 start_codon:yes stop_codon:yes gene_type:complete
MELNSRINRVWHVWKIIVIGNIFTLIVGKDEFFPGQRGVVVRVGNTGRVKGFVKVYSPTRLWRKQSSSTIAICRVEKGGNWRGFSF